LSGSVQFSEADATGSNCPVQLSLGASEDIRMGAI